jgi:L-proline---[L-prolyl-carrier protein] ligase
MSLHDLVIRSAQHTPDALAISGPDGSLTYRALDQTANRLARLLADLGVSQGDRVGIWLDKSVCGVAAMQAILRLGAVYVPLDPLSPTLRVRMIAQDCAVRALVTTTRRASVVLTGDLARVACLCVDGPPGPGRTWADLAAYAADPLAPTPFDDDQLAYILYTSGSTGTPKGVCISHRNALAFVEWAAAELRAAATDRFANHAPFHFDLSVLDLYAAFCAAATVVLVPDGMSYIARQLVDFIIREQISIWYSVPSVLVLMLEHGGLVEASDLPLRAILFAGEPFPIKYLRCLYQRWQAIRYLNLYGPTETNVCTFYDVQASDMQRAKPVPIGRACSGDHVWAVAADGSVVQPGGEGELMVAGPTVMRGYWGQPPHGDRPYATGDLVQLAADRNYLYIGRRDHMLKVRGNRIEPGDIEAALLEHPAIQEAAVIVVGAAMAERLVAVIVASAEAPPSLLDIKRHCAERLPRAMIVNAVRFRAALPRTRNGKIDYLALVAAEQS